VEATYGVRVWKINGLIGFRWWHSKDVRVWRTSGSVKVLRNVEVTGDWQVMDDRVDDVCNWVLVTDA